MKQFELDIETRIFFGTRILNEAIGKIKDMLPANILIVTTGRSLYKNGYIEQLVQALQKNGGVETAAIYDKVSPNPRLSEAKEAVELGRKNKVQLVIGFGGGSAIDAAKAAAVGIPIEEPLDDYFFKGKEPGEKTLPIIAIPTTAGTGSELSRGAILSSPEHCIKNGIRGSEIVPKAAIVDSSFTYSISIEKTMEMGFDVLAHAMESYVAVKANRFSEMISEKIIRIIGNALPRLKENINDYDAREAMCFASMIAGFNLAGVGTCLPHRMQYVIGAKTDTSHAAGLIALFPAWVAYEYDASPRKVSEMLDWLGQPAVFTGEQARTRMLQFMNGLGLHATLRSLGIEEAELSGLAGQVKGNIANDPLAETENIMDVIFKESF